ncbi:MULTISPECIES: holin [Ruminococcus]|uniref:holin n=1 Tax=Ruminococcus TaxID=1263 RepID=UPI0026BB8D4E
MKNFKQWLKCATVRAIKTIAQTAVSTIGVTAMMDEVNWVAVVSASLLSGILSMLTSISGLPEVKEDTTNAKGN